MEPLLTFSEALAAMREGKAVARAGWQPDAYGVFKSLVLIPGREIVASFKPMTNYIGEGTAFTVEDHIDAIYSYPEANGGGYVTVVGEALSQQDILTDDWKIVEKVTL